MFGRATRTRVSLSCKFVAGCLSTCAAKSGNKDKTSGAEVGSTKPGKKAKARKSVTDTLEIGMDQELPELPFVEKVVLGNEDTANAEEADASTAVDADGKCVVICGPYNLLWPLGGATFLLKSPAGPESYLPFIGSLACLIDWFGFREIPEGGARRDVQHDEAAIQPVYIPGVPSKGCLLACSAVLVHG